MKVVNKGILHVFSKLTPSGVTKYITSFYHLLTCVTQFVCTDRCSYETVNFKNNDSVLEDLNQEICLLIIFNEFSKGFFALFTTLTKVENTSGSISEHIKQVLVTSCRSLIPCLAKKVYTCICALIDKGK